MPYEHNPRNFEPPRADVSAFYDQIMSVWLKYERDHLFSYIDLEGAKRKPCIAFGCGNEEVTINVKTALLLREALKEEPELLNEFLDDWLLANVGNNVAHSISSLSAKPKRRLGSKPKPKIVEPKKSRADCTRQTVDNISDAIDSVLK